MRIPHSLTKAATLVAACVVPLLISSSCGDGEQCGGIGDNPRACGACGKVCEADQVCEQEQCKHGTCSPGFWQCGSQCCSNSDGCSDGKCVPGCSVQIPCGPGMACNGANMCTPGCFIKGVSYANDEVHPVNSCSKCDASSPHGWTDSIRCESGMVCAKGKCVTNCASDQHPCGNKCCDPSDQCTPEGCIGSCSVGISPAIGIGTGGSCPASCTDCICPTNGTSKCHGLYDGWVTDINYESGDPTANFTFSKLPGGTINAGTQYWLVTVEATHSATCNQIFGYTVRANGTFGSSSTVQSVNTVSIWGSASNYSNATSGDRQCFLLITDGAGSPGQKTWFQPTQICFQKRC